MRVTIRGAEISCEVVGKGGPVVFIHGFPLRGTMWSHAASRLPPGFRAIVPDLRGHGGSTVSSDVSIARFADDLIALLDALGETRPAVFAGLSMGGIVCFEVWRRHAARVRALALCDTRATPETPQGAVRRESLARLALERGSGAVVDQMLPSMFAPGFDPLLREHWRRVMSATANVGLAAASRALASRPDSLLTLPTITVPVLAVVGELDAITPVDSMRDLFGGLPESTRSAGSRFEVIAGAGHVPPAEKPEEFSRVFNDWLVSLC